MAVSGLCLRAVIIRMNSDCFRVKAAYKKKDRLLMIEYKRKERWSDNGSKKKTLEPLR
jgi:hypothetical protein